MEPKVLLDRDHGCAYELAGAHHCLRTGRLTARAQESPGSCDQRRRRELGPVMADRTDVQQVQVQVQVQQVLWVWHPRDDDQVYRA